MFPQNNLYPQFFGVGVVRRQCLHWHFTNDLFGWLLRDFQNTTRYHPGVDIKLKLLINFDSCKLKPSNEAKLCVCYHGSHLTVVVSCCVYAGSWRSSAPEKKSAQWKSWSIRNQKWPSWGNLQSLTKIMKAWCPGFVCMCSPSLSLWVLALPQSWICGQFRDDMFGFKLGFIPNGKKMYSTHFLWGEVANPVWSIVSPTAIHCRVRLSTI